MRFSWGPCSDVTAPPRSWEQETGNTGLAVRVVINGGISLPLLPRASSPRGRLCEQSASRRAPWFLVNTVVAAVVGLRRARRGPRATDGDCSLMPHDSRRRAPARLHRAHGEDAGRGRSDLGAAPAPRGTPVRPDRPGRPARPAKRRRPAEAADRPQTELHRALAAAAG